MGDSKGRSDRVQRASMKMAQVLSGSCVGGQELAALLRAAGVLWSLSWARYRQGQTGLPLAIWHFTTGREVRKCEQCGLGLH